MIREAHGNLLDADVDALVNTVNTEGVMGKGIALQFKRAFPSMFNDYVRAVKAGRVRLGHMHVWETGALDGPRFVINFPTKRHWRSRSRLGDIELGLDDLVRVVEELGVRSIAVPPLGCGNGGLDWRDVEPRIREALAAARDVEVLLYTPNESPPAAEMRSSTKRPSMTPGRAALIRLLQRYTEFAFGASLVEVQKLMYFLQTVGEPLRLQYVKGRYGPYADNLRHVLALVEGHYLSGYGDGSKQVHDAEPIFVLASARASADAVLATHPETNTRIEQVMRLIDGFESEYGLELLASVHWVAAHDNPRAVEDVDLAVDLVQRWTVRKAGMFTSEHITAAWHALRERGWLPAPVG